MPWCSRAIPESNRSRLGEFSVVMLIAPQRKGTLTTFDSFSIQALFFTCWLEDDSPACCEARTRDHLIDNSCKKTDASDKEWNSMIFFTFLWQGSHSFISKPSPNYIQFKTQALIKLSAFCRFCDRKYQPGFLTKIVLFCCNSDKRWAVSKH